MSAEQPHLQQKVFKACHCGVDLICNVYILNAIANLRLGHLRVPLRPNEQGALNVVGFGGDKLHHHHGLYDHDAAGAAV